MNKIIFGVVLSVLLSGCTDRNNISININNIITPGEMETMKSWCIANNSQLSYVAIVLGLDSFGVHGKLAVCDSGSQISLKDINRSNNNAPQ